ncbi:MAG: thioredoxin family protein [Bacteroidetes bacterium]|nr:thioredoxin family protein [Bacteroidota bacterium]
MIDIKVFGPGCPSCKKLESLCNEVITENNIQASIKKISDINEFANYGIFLSPGLVVNGKVLVQGKLPAKRTLENWIKKEVEKMLEE